MRLDMTQISHGVRRHTVVGMFPTDRAGVAAMYALDRAGFEPGRVEMVADDPPRAAEIGATTFATAGLIVSALFGFAVVVAVAVWGDLGRDPFGLVLGSLGVVGGFAVIGLVIGRTLGHDAPDAALFARAIRRGGAVVSVQCIGTQRDLAMEVLSGAGARAVRDEHLGVVKRSVVDSDLPQRGPDGR
jgi:hypothetical protein